MKKVILNTGWTMNGRSVVLPHDAMIHTERTADSAGRGAEAYFQGGSYTYEKKFRLPDDWKGLPVHLCFDGVYKNPEVFLNGEKKGGTAYGYLPFTVDLGVLPEGDNTITVLCENKDLPDSRWYSGAGIFRPVTAWVGSGFLPEQIRVSTLQLEPDPVLAVDVPREACVSVLDGEKVLAEGTGTHLKLTVPGARLWSCEDPYLYTVEVSAGTETTSIRTGIRQLSWSRYGFLVNGRETKLRGGAIHPDNGILGAASFAESERRKVRILKENGYNAVRCAHNPASLNFIEACDELGLYVIDEMWDMWYVHKTPYDYASRWKDQYESDIEAVVRRDFSHPSVIAYSIGNEVSEPVGQEGLNTEYRIVSKFHSLDTTRPVTGGFNLMILAMSAKGKTFFSDQKDGKKSVDTAASGTEAPKKKKDQGMNSTLFNLITSVVGSRMNHSADSSKADRIISPALNLLDMAGYNYASGRYEKDGRLHPNRLIYGSETFPQDIARNWQMVEKYPYLAGDFMWTAWDYLGETGIGAWAYGENGKGFSKPYPWILADTGAIDILGNPGAEAFWAAAVWHRLSRPAITVRPLNHPGEKPHKAIWRGTNGIPSWSWKGCEGNTAVVEVFYDADTVELELNGRKAGSARVKDCRAVLRIPYQPGTLCAVAYDKDKKEIGRNTLTSAGKADLVLWPEQQEVHPGELVYIKVCLADRQGIVESNEDRKICLSVSGASLMGFGSAAPCTRERYDSGTFTTYYGRALCAVLAGEEGTITLKAWREDLPEKVVSLQLSCPAGNMM